jgi:hypothetical protein
MRLDDQLLSAMRTFPVGNVSMHGIIHDTLAASVREQAKL